MYFYPHQNTIEMITVLTVIPTIDQLFRRVFMFDELRKRRFGIEGLLAV